MVDTTEVPGAAPRSRGRPRGTTARGAETRQRLYDTAITLIASRGWQASTLRDVAREAGVSVGLLYRYFPSKHAILLALYDQISLDYVRRVELPRGRWRDRFIYALRTHLEVLRPHRATLAALLPVLVGTSEEGLFAPGTAFARERAQGILREAVLGASDAPPPPVDAALARLLYMLNLCVVLWWSLEKTPGQRATDQLVALLVEALRPFALVIRIPSVRRLLLKADTLVREALLDDASPSPTVAGSHAVLRSEEGRRSP